ncbi:MAG: metallophosphoesterase [Actinomycetota bacterium]|nr:metallophosphoesterase [Actinomycetota bacterium]
MRVHVVSDVHGSVDALARAGDGADALVVLGDLISFIDYADHGAGIMGELFGPDAVARLIDLRTSQRFDDAREWSRGLWSRLGGDHAEIVEDAVRRQYAEMFAVLPTPTYLTYGNVDIPRLWQEFTREGMFVLDGETTEIGGRRFGFVGGGLRTPYNTPYEIDDETYAAKVDRVGAVDVLCTHIPPDLPELLYDVAARRFERGSAALLDHVRRTQPAMLLFGHVHQPLHARRRVGRTECVNVGHFRGSGQPYALAW